MRSSAIDPLAEAAGAAREWGGCWLYAQEWHQVRWGAAGADGGLHWPDGKQPDPACLVELRAFCEGGELIVWRVSGGFRTALLEDPEPRAESDSVTEIEKIDHLLRGDRAEPWAGDGTGMWTRLTDGRGADYLLPASLTDADIERRVRLRVHQTIAPDPDTGIARVAQARLAGFFGAAGSLKRSV